MKVITDPERIDAILNRGVIVDVLPSKEEFRKKLLAGERMRFYLGGDATGNNLHLSHAKNFMLLEEFRQLGHEAIFLIGDFTARIGDPSAQEGVRKVLSKEEVSHNVKLFRKQVKNLLTLKKASENPAVIKYNSKWLSKLKFEQILELAANFTVQQMLERNMFAKRMQEQRPIYLHEFLYPLMQGYDSVAMNVDAEIGGTDQTFNMLAGRTLLKRVKNKEKFVVVVNLLENPKTGALMSKSKGIGVFLGATPKEMFGQIMAQPDEMIEILYINCTRVPLDEIALLMKKTGAEVKKVKLRLAEKIVEKIHGKEATQRAREEFERVFSKKDLPEKLEEIRMSGSPIDLLSLLTETKLTRSRSEARRLIEGGAVEVNQRVIVDPEARIEMEKDVVLRVGKKKFIKIIPN
jgi:tyrosyl-tRNA synthetase